METEPMLTREEKSTLPEIFSSKEDGTHDPRPVPEIHFACYWDVNMASVSVPPKLFRMRVQTEV